MIFSLSNILSLIFHYLLCDIGASLAVGHPSVHGSIGRSVGAYSSVKRFSKLRLRPGLH